MTSMFIIDRSRKVVELARKYNLLIVCDDVYNLLFFPSPDGSIPVCTTRLFAYDDRSLKKHSSMCSTTN